ncbi:hypothetical protein DFA_05150 [Cavenderia fasciculata]|uniref:Uncharacterized protein n=1 Tax=Cavenderia fasciculata TaxID=261658 RepID=F4PNG7_CACFS|nr:uncharacterized protein DFA_05150 [Cavenderia fasciculata]EGG23020.1 hypothetical protein DFA_05150 [Cavenderia fasciculata]|eukprot:XP_004360871.1 hypothetical protein DFA_05150 [Cavenderia fasciculata]
MECIRRRADQVILDITYKLCNLECNTTSDDDIIYDKDNIHPSTALIQLLFTKSPDGTDNDKCLFHHLSYETKKHMHEIILEHIKQLKEFVHHEMELIQLIISNQYNNDEDIYLFIIQTFNWVNTLFDEKMVDDWDKDQYGPMILIMIDGILKMNNYTNIRDKYLDVIYDTLDTIFRVYKHQKIFKGICKDNYVYMFVLVFKQYSFQDQRGKELKKVISQTIRKELWVDESNDQWDSQVSCDFFKEYITTIFMDAHNYDYFIPPEQPNDLINVQYWNGWKKEERELIADQLRVFSAYHHPKILSILFQHFKQCLTQTWKDKLIVLNLLNMLETWSLPDHRAKKWIKYFSIDFLKTVISETLKEDNILVQCELLEFIKQFGIVPYYWKRKMIIKSIEFRDIIKEAFNHIIINQASPPHPRLLYSLINACDDSSDSPGIQIKQIFSTEPFWQEYIVNLVLKSVQSNQKVVISRALALITRYPVPQFTTNLKALSTTVIALLDRFQIDDDILSGVIRFFNHTHQLGFKETNQLIQRILFSQQYEPIQINHFVERSLIKWIGDSANNLSIYLPTIMKRIIDQQIEYFCIDSFLIMYKQPHQATNQYIQHLITIAIQLNTSDVIEKTKIAELLSILFTRTVEYKGGNITTDQILQIIDLIVQTQLQSGGYGDGHTEVGDLIKILVSMDDQWNTIEMISSRVIDRVVDCINQNMESEHLSKSGVELVVDFYNLANPIVPPIITISPTTEKISYFEWIDRLILVFKKSYDHSYHKDIIKKLKLLKENKLK